MIVQSRSVSVRMAVAVDENGLWSAAGNCAYESDESTIEAAEDYLPLEVSPRRHVVSIEAKVPIPDGLNGEFTRDQWRTNGEQTPYRAAAG